ncbi:hypothetical protein GYN07_13325 [Rhizobium leguminosarum bv. viciae 248]|uniref:hypothetical protein n=1 Tax=Rhizobium leguminosarum TaxID=384 RepID=UPI000377F625|nr:hypothetical protein [Rhizobium leguminosarum]MCA2408989.1 hypothetical protein [Rhizobium leguminosarum]NKM62976.1 hypothetical protein [Rhizobium leguminosarum bv. viciae]QHW25252.1 hypothetical protein GYN07_13325 [Rhizobium leguminosarum bv. viciae 248]
MRVKIQLFHAVICFYAALATQSACAGEVKDPQRIGNQPPDPSCKVVTDAYENRKLSGYLEIVSGVTEAEKDQQYVKILYWGGRVYEKYDDTVKWLRSPPGPPVAGTRFSDCRPVGKASELHYDATWQRESDVARAEIWLTPDGKKLHRVIRHFRSKSAYLPFQTATSAYEYDAERIQIPPESLIIDHE